MKSSPIKRTSGTMKRILALDTSSDSCSVALRAGGETRSVHCDTPRQHSQKLLPMVDQLLSEAELKVAHLDAIAFGCGPGSFTGIRICLSVVQGLAFAYDIPVIPVSTLWTIAQSSLRRGETVGCRNVMVLMDARMDEVYRGLFRVGDSVEKVMEDALVAATADTVLSDIGRSDLEHLGIVGTGLRYPELATIQAALYESDAQPEALDILTLVDSDPLTHAAIAPESAEPVYLRGSGAWKKRAKVRSAIKE